MDLENLFSKQIEGQLFENRTIFVSEAINSRVAHKVINALLALEAKAPGKDIQFYINSPGGEVNSGLSLIHISEPTRPY